VPFAEMYNFNYVPPPRIVPRRRITGVRGRIDAGGKVLIDLSEDDVLEAARHLVEDEGVEAIAVMFLNSYINPVHEQRAGSLIRKAFPTVATSISTEITREYREYERLSTTVLEAYTRPAFERYIDVLEQDLREDGFAGTFLVMRSGGGAMTSDVAKRSPLLAVLSGPAGGIVGASHLGESIKRENLISFDVGGTTLDACVIQNGQPAEVHEAEIDGYPLLIPLFDIRSIGAGGGSIGWIDDGLLRVGPQSAGAEPGPVGYGRGGTEPTLTDAAICLGYFTAAEFLNGDMSIDEAAARRAVTESVGRPLALGTVEAAAAMFRVTLARTVGAIREITVERGLDPRDFSLLAFGGAGPMLAPMLMREMEIGEVIIPPGPSAFSALGMLMSDLECLSSKTVLLELDSRTLDSVESTFVELEAATDDVLAAQRVPPARRLTERRFDLRYVGQEHSISLTVHTGQRADSIREQFHAAHLDRYGHSMDDDVEVAALRVRGVGMVDKPEFGFQVPSGDKRSALVTNREAFDFATGILSEFRVLERSGLVAGECVTGPAIVRDGTSNLVIHSDQEVRVDQSVNLLVTRAAAS
jgi:N-methylhydantoinase A